MSDSVKPTVLVCTVGGSHAPILSAIGSYKPNFVWFICTEGKAGSLQQVRGRGNCIKKSPRDEAPSLPNIPTQASLREDEFDVVLVPPDDPDSIHQHLRKLIDRILVEPLRPRVIADYTGGTKSMTAALLLAGLEYEDDVELSMVVGQRADLIHVTDGTEIPFVANVERIRFSHKFRVALSPWKHFGYAESAVALETMRQPRHSRDRKQYLDALAASRGFAAWDGFDHATARQLLQPLGHIFGQYLATLASLNRGDEAQPPARLADLYRNLERRAERRQYDDAVARAYRLLEWTAQWLLDRDANVDTSNVSPDCIPNNLSLPRNDKGQYFAGLRNAWILLETHGKTDAVRLFARDCAKESLSLLTTRNHSILAHGFQPITQAEWNQWQVWLNETFFPFLETEVRASGLKLLPQQLPTEFSVESNE